MYKKWPNKKHYLAIKNRFLKLQPLSVKVYIER